MCDAQRVCRAGRLLRLTRSGRHRRCLHAAVDARHVFRRRKDAIDAPSRKLQYGDGLAVWGLAVPGRRPLHVFVFMAFLRDGRPRASTDSWILVFWSEHSTMSYSSPYEEAVLTKEHPKKVDFRPLEHLPYIESSPLGTWLATRLEEGIVVAFMASVFVGRPYAHCCSFYAVSWTALYPFRQIVHYSYDVVAACVVILVLAGYTRPKLPSRKAVAEMPAEQQEKAKAAAKAAAKASATRRRLALALCAIITLARWQYGDLNAALAAVMQLGKK